MPVRIRRVRPRLQGLRLDDLSIAEILDFLAGWSPPKTEFDRQRSRWRTWGEFLSDYMQLREEVLAFAAGGEVFAETVLRRRGVPGARRDG
jgi:hypothetical protein